MVFWTKITQSSSSKRRIKKKEAGLGHIEKNWTLAKNNSKTTEEDPKIISKSRTHEMAEVDIF
jgi:hypothetical protein